MNTLSTKIYDLIKVVSALTTPIDLLGGVVSGIWLAVLGEWSLLIYGGVILITSPLIVSIILAPSWGIGMWAAKNVDSKGSNYRIFLAGFLTRTYLAFAVSTFCLGVLVFFMYKSSTNNFIPVAIWSYSIAMAPWEWFASKEPNESSIRTVFFTSAAFLISVLVMAWSASLKITCITFFAIMMIDAFLALLDFHSVNHSDLNSDTKT